MQQNGKAREMASGKWPGLLKSVFGVDEKHLTGKNGPCPICGGKDRYRWIRSTRGGQWICNQCRPNGADGAELAMAVIGAEYKEVAKMIEQSSGSIEPVKEVAAKDPNILLDRIARECREVTRGSVVARYLQGRGIAKGSKAIRQHPGLDYWDGGERIGRYPAMIARVQDATGGRQTYHVTYLDDGGKASVPSPKKIMPHCGGLTGAGVYLDRVGETVAVCEGVETGLFIQSTLEIPVIAATSAHGLEHLMLPDVVTEAAIFSDNDPSFVGQRAAYSLASRLARGGVSVKVFVPVATGDYLDNGGELEEMLKKALDTDAERR